MARDATESKILLFQWGGCMQGNPGYLWSARIQDNDMEKKKVNLIGNLYGSHNGRAVYCPFGGGICATITSTDYKHNKMIVIWKRK